MAARANWKGYLRLSLVSCPVALYPATSESEKVRFNQLNKNTGNRIRYADENPADPPAVSANRVFWAPARNSAAMPRLREVGVPDLWSLYAGERPFWAAFSRAARDVSDENRACRLETGS
jgi:hypothetical protein